ncbi:MAG: geranylgeranylglyceryl/heptaprenylglyceryl phosphate synthase [Candidatus Delongbacteria bacterium]|nr:geranylgeranylglyceryl/heptaprenylglyceryl phosphate synthase [Candidatus Delongbacteria bacterium]MCG2760987.1 geranylgeranylglyceryl/heptaprenylglyceryl phosphate synthase [Candidatus Delongbacteria bacterium]
MLIKKEGYRAGLIVLIDPDKIEIGEVKDKVNIYQKQGADAFFFGSSQPVKNNIHALAKEIRDNSKIPLILFPGSSEQVTPNADGILFITLISGRNPDYLIEHHVKAAPFVKKMGLKVLPTAYLLIECGYRTSVERVSRTQPLPASNIPNIVAHALAGEMIGMRFVYLEAGSGAKNPVSPEIIAAVKAEISVPLIVGGGIRTPEYAKTLVEAGADFIVVGNVLERSDDKDIVRKFSESMK